MKKIAIALFVLLVLCQLGFSDFAGFEQEYGGMFESQFEGNWMELAVLAILVCLFFNTLTYMAGELMQSQGLKRYAKAEFLQVSASSLMIFFAVALLYGITNSGFGFMGDILGTGSTISCSAAEQGRMMIWDENEPFGSGPIGAFKCKVQAKINALDRAYNNVVAANMGMERLTSMCIYLFGAPVYCFDWDQDLHNRVEEAHLIATKIVSLLMPLHAQYVLAEYVQKNMLAIFLPVGLVLRIFPFTRGIGGLFIAIAIGLFFVWPTFFLLTDPTFVKQDERLDTQQQGMCYTGFRGASVVLAGVLSYGPNSPEALATASGAELVFQITIATLFYPFVALVIALIFIRAMTPLLGGDLGELMKMVARLG